MKKIKEHVLYYSIILYTSLFISYIMYFSNFAFSISYLIISFFIYKIIENKIKFLKYLIIYYIIFLVAIFIPIIIFISIGISKTEPKFYSSSLQLLLSNIPSIISILIAIIYFSLIYRSKALHGNFYSNNKTNHRKKSLLIYIFPIIIINSIFLLNGINNTPSKYAKELLNYKNEGSIINKKVKGNYFTLSFIKGIPGFFKYDSLILKSNGLEINILDGKTKILSTNESEVIMNVFSKDSKFYGIKVSNLFILEKKMGIFKLRPYEPQYTLSNNILSIKIDKYSKYITALTLLIKGDISTITSIKIDDVSNINLLNILNDKDKYPFEINEIKDVKILSIGQHEINI